jgi:protein-S-isoprenylcysteine O-methyltransferase Ste14
LVSRVDAPAWVVVSGTVLAVAAVLLMVDARRSLGDRHSPWVAPARKGLATAGAYRFLRHPIYLS